MIARSVSVAALAALLALLGACGPMLPGTPSAPARPTPSRPAPIADRLINLEGACDQTEDDGFHENARLSVRDNQVRALSWQMRIGRRGSCSFELGAFQQIKSRPHIELVERDGSGCKLMVWQEPRRITMAHTGCAKHCTPGVYESAWPVMFDPATGGCARP